MKRQKRPNTLIQRQKRPRTDAKETQYKGKREVIQRQKRP
jgi:hypothetical protein